MTTKPVVSIVCITFNQRKFIKETLDSFLMQKTNFAFEVLIHDDASTDGTKQVIQEYVEIYPDIIKPIYEEENQYSKGDYSFINATYERATGKYIAFCEGDDFWIDPEKLQIQVDFLEHNTSYALCFHPVRVFFENKDKPEMIYPDKCKKINFTLRELLKWNYIQSNSILYRRQKYDNLPSDIIPSDWYMHLYHAQFGKIGFINKVMSAYRRHEGGIWWDMHSNADRAWTNHGIQHLSLFDELLDLFGGIKVYKDILVTHVYSLMNILIDVDTRGNEKLVQQAINSSPKIIEIFLLEQQRMITTMQLDISKKDAELIEKIKSEEILRYEIGERDKAIVDIKSSRLWKLSLLYRKIKTRFEK